MLKKTPRYRHSEKFVRTNFSLGDDRDVVSTYRQNFNTNPSQGAPSSFSNHCHLVPSCTQCKYTALLSGFRSARPRDKLHRKAREEGNAIADQKNALSRSSVTFGNDPASHMTAYQEFAHSPPDGTRTSLISPPKDAQVLPPVDQCKVSQRSSLRNDFTYFGDQISNNIYQQRLKDIEVTQRLNTTDSVAKSLLGRRRPMLTRSMLDYRHPVERVRHNIKNVMVQRVSPYVRQDSIWSVASSAGKQCYVSESQRKFTWPPDYQATQRYCRGGSNNITR